jgi:thiol-disulfide isomerase/thioredoxin
MAREKFKYWAQSILGGLALAAIIFSGTLLFQNRSEPEVDATPRFAEKRLPANTLVNFKGKDVALTDLYSSDKNLTIFWATWCGPCVDEIKKMPKFLPKIKQKGYSPVFVNYDQLDNKQTVEAFAKKYGIETAYDFQGELLYSLGISSLPVSLVVDKSGKITRTFWGELSESNL